MSDDQDRRRLLRRQVMITVLLVMVTASGTAVLGWLYRLNGTGASQHPGVTELLSDRPSGARAPFSVVGIHPWQLPIVPCGRDWFQSPAVFQQLFASLPPNRAALRDILQQRTIAAYAASGRWELADEELRQLSSIPTDPAVRAMAAQIVRRAALRRAARAERQHRYGDALVAYKLAIHTGRCGKAVYIRLIKLLCEAGRVEEAAAVLHNAMRYGCHLSDIELEHLHVEFGRSQARRALWQQLALLLSRNRSSHKAIQLCLAHLASDTTAQGALTLAVVLQNASPLGNHCPQADEILENACRRHPHNVELQSATGTLRIMQGRGQDALRYFRAALSTDPNHVPSLNNMALVLAQNPSSLDQALVYVERALAIAGRNDEVSDTKTTILNALGQAAEAQDLHRRPEL